MRINKIVLVKLAQIGETQEIGNTEGKAQVFNTLYFLKKEVTEWKI
jgi:hypothetical protein